MHGAISQLRHDFITPGVTCLSIQDPASFDPVFSSDEYQLSGRTPKYTCVIEIIDPSTTADILIENTAAENRMYNSFNFYVESPNNDTCRKSTCKTRIELQITQNTGESFSTTSSLVITDEQENVTSLTNVTTLELNYQTCLDEQLRFTLPIAGRVN